MFAWCRGSGKKKLLAQDMTEIWSLVIVVWASSTSLEYRLMDGDGYEMRGKVK